jgi:hypothetical protein
MEVKKNFHLKKIHTSPKLDLSLLKGGVYDSKSKHGNSARKGIQNHDDFRL